MKIAVEGCCHGELDNIFEAVSNLENECGEKIELLLICGDFQSIRNRGDLDTMAVPPKYRQLNTFYKYYSGEKVAPVLTIFIGGNHEASAFLQELPYGGWVAKNIYYLGYAGVVNVKNIKIAGLSGIYKDHDYNKGHFERPPYTESTKRSCYHIRNIDVFRLKQMKSDIDIFLSHDWPQGIYDYGDSDDLVRRKRFFKQEVQSGTLGNPAARELLFKLKPKYWFSAHLHCKFTAVVGHMDDSGVAIGETKFLALDKCLPRRQFLQVIDIPTTDNENDNEIKISLDPEWLAILKLTNHFLSLSPTNCYIPGGTSDGRNDYSASEENIQQIKKDFNDNLLLPDNFYHTAPPIITNNNTNNNNTNNNNTNNNNLNNSINKTKNNNLNSNNRSLLYINPQTELLCTKLNLTNPFAEFFKMNANNNSGHDGNISYVDYDYDGGDDNDTSNCLTMSTLSSSCSSSFCLEKTQNPDEILLDDDDCDEINNKNNFIINEELMMNKEIKTSSDFFNNNNNNDGNDDDEPTNAKTISSYNSNIPSTNFHRTSSIDTTTLDTTNPNITTINSTTITTTNDSFNMTNDLGSITTANTTSNKIDDVDGSAANIITNNYFIATTATTTTANTTTTTTTITTTTTSDAVTTVDVIPDEQPKKNKILKRRNVAIYSILNKNSSDEGETM